MIDEIANALNAATKIPGVVWNATVTDDGRVVLEWLVEAGSDADTGEDLSDAMDGSGGVADGVAERFGLVFEGDCGGSSGCISDGVRYTGGAYSAWSFHGLSAVEVGEEWGVEDLEGGTWLPAEPAETAGEALIACKFAPMSGTWRQ